MTKEEENAFLAKFWLVIIAIMALLWFVHDEAKIKRIHELEDECAAYEEKIYDLEKTIDDLEEENNFLREEKRALEEDD